MDGGHGVLGVAVGADPLGVLRRQHRAANHHLDLGHQMCIRDRGKELGIYMYIYTGGEPLVRKKDLIALCEKHNDVAFLSLSRIHI